MNDKTLERLLARVAIEDLNTEFAYRVDHDLSDTIADLFTPDGSYGRVDGPRSAGREAIRESYAQRSARGPRTARHLFTNLRLEFESAMRVRGTTVLLLFADDGLPPLPAVPLAVSEFEDVYVCVDGAWMYESRTIRSIFTDAGGRKTVIPLGNK